MKLHYKGKYDLNPESIPTKPHRPNYVKFKEPEDPKKLSSIVTMIAIPLLMLFGIPLFLMGNITYTEIAIGLVLFLLSAFPHEMLHAICFKEDVYLFTNLKHGMLFVVGPEDMSKGRFIFMSILPTIVFGLIPYSIFLFYPNLLILGAFGTVSIAAGSGDYLNIFNAITQMPKGSKTYLYQFNSYWYMPEK